MTMWKILVRLEYKLQWDHLLEYYVKSRIQIQKGTRDIFKKLLG